MNVECGSEDWHYSIDDLLKVMTILRDPEKGCPWDIKQSFESIVPSTLEECYELADAIERQDLPHVAEELGDVLFQVIFYSQLGSEEKAFDFESVVHGLVDKLIRRHPHIFPQGDIDGGERAPASAESVSVSWEALKQRERAAKAQHGALDDVPLALPALARAQKLQKRAANAGVDWSEFKQVLSNLEDEIGELKEALADGDTDHIEDGLGDVLFSAVNVGRHLRMDNERALRRANRKFERRFRMMEAEAMASNTSLEKYTPEQLHTLWQAAKASD